MIRTADGKLHFTEKEKAHFSFVRKGRLGKPWSEETRKKISLIPRKKWSKESKEKMRATIIAGYQKGRIPHNKGKNKSNYDPLKIVSEKMAGNKNPSGRFGALNGMFGKKNPHLKRLNKLWIGGKHKDETKIRMSLKAKSSWLKTREKRIIAMKKVWCKHLGKTYLEKKFESFCKKYNLPFRYVGNGKLWITALGVHMNPDFVDTIKKRILVEVYAKCWKSNDYEEIRGRLLGKAGFRTIFFNNDIMDSEDWEHQCIDKLKLFISSR